MRQRTTYIVSCVPFTLLTNRIGRKSWLRNAFLLPQNPPRAFLETDYRLKSFTDSVIKFPIAGPDVSAKPDSEQIRDYRSDIRESFKPFLTRLFAKKKKEKSRNRSRNLSRSHLEIPNSLQVGKFIDEKIHPRIQVTRIAAIPRAREKDNIVECTRREISLSKCPIRNKNERNRAELMATDDVGTGPPPPPPI